MTAAIKKVSEYLALRAGSEWSIAEATGLTREEIYSALTHLLENDLVQLYLTASGEEYYRNAARVHLESTRSRPNQATAWGVAFNLEDSWQVNAQCTETQQPVVVEAVQPTAAIAVVCKPVRPRAPRAPRAIKVKHPKPVRAKPRRFQIGEEEPLERSDEDYYQSL